MTGALEVLPLSEDLHAVPAVWPAPPAARVPALVRQARAGWLLDTARRQASLLGCPAPAWPAEPQPVGLLYGEEGVRAIGAWVEELRQRLHAAGLTPEWLGQLESFQRELHRSIGTQTPLLRLYAYAAESPEAIVTIVGARKAFVFWDTEMGAGSSESWPDLSAIWAAGEALEAAPGSRPSGGAAAAPEPAAARLARSWEGVLREQDAGVGGERANMARLDQLLAEDAVLHPFPSAQDVLPARAGILWRPRRLDLVDVARLSRCLRPRPGDPLLAGILDFVESASRERAELLLRAFCTDSPEAV